MIAALALAVLPVAGSHGRLDTPIWGAIGALIAPPAYAGPRRQPAPSRALERRRNRNGPESRSPGNTRSPDDAQKSVDQLQHALAAQKAAAAQQAEAAQQRAQQLQQAAAAQQRRLQQLQQIEASQRRAQNMQRQAETARRRMKQMQAVQAPKAAAQELRATLPRQQRPAMLPHQQHRAALQDTMRKIRERGRGAGRADLVKLNAHKQVSVSAARHQAALQHALTKLRRHAPSHAGSSRHIGRGEGVVARHGGIGRGGHRPHAALQRTLDKLRHRSNHAGRQHGHGSLGHGHRGPRHHAAFERIREKLSSRRGRREMAPDTAEAPASTPTPTPAPAPTPAPVVQTPPPTTPSSTPKSTTKTKTKTTPSLLPQTPDLSKVATPFTTPVRTAPNSGGSGSTSDPGLSRLGGPQDPDDETGSRRTRTAKKSDSDDRDGGSALKARRGLGRRVAGALLPLPETFKPNELLAINISRSGLDKAAQLKFRHVDTVHLPALGLHITRLETPDVQNAVIGRTTLHEVLPEEGFGLNHIYKVGPTGPEPKPAGSEPRTQSGATPSPKRAIGNGGSRHGIGCAPDRCFGTSVIKWQPQLAACARGTKIGVIDTGVDTNHPTFAGLRFEHRDFTPPKAKKPSNQHGTGIFSLLAGNPKGSTPGLVPDAAFLVGDAFFADSGGNAVSDTLTMLKALNWLKSARVDVANLSFAGPRDELVEDAIRELAKSGAVIVAAAGNEGPEAPPSYPAAYREVIAVTAVDRKLAPYIYANRGTHIDVAAPGVDVWTALPNRGAGLQTGTSFAVPFVTSLVALNYRADGLARHGDPLEPKQRALELLQGNIKALGGRGRTAVFGAGLVQAPTACEPRGSSTVASAQPNVHGWSGTVQAAPAEIQPQGGSWAGTVQRAGW